MKRVLIISYYWPPSGGAGVQRWLKFSKFLPEFGWEPVILTVDPEKATYPVLDESLIKDQSDDLEVVRTNSKEWFSVYKKMSGSKQVPYAGFASESNTISFKQKVARFVRGNFFLPDPRKGWNKYAVRAARDLITQKNIDCIITTGPPQSSQLIGLKLSRAFNIPWIADFRDPWTDIYYNHQFYPTRLAQRINLNYEKRVLKQAHLILTVSQGFKDIFVAKNIIDPGKVTIIPNGYDDEDFLHQDESKGSDFVLTYVGTLSDIYQIDNFIEAFLALVKKHPNSKLRFIGSVSNQQLNKLSRIPEENIEVIPHVEHKVAIEYMEKSNALLLVIPEHSSGQGILPGKIFEYMASERNVLGIGPVNGDSSSMLRETKAGTMLSYDDKEGIKKTLLQYYQASQDLELPGKEKKYLQYSRKNLSNELAGKMNSLIR